jgi:ATP-dependent Clp protease adapter protein ClpS
MRIFGHPVELAVKIMAEAHVRGRAIAEVEVRMLADIHMVQLRNAGIQAHVEKI